MAATTKYRWHRQKQHLNYWGKKPCTLTSSSWIRALRQSSRVSVGSVPHLLWSQKPEARCLSAQQQQRHQRPLTTRQLGGTEGRTPARMLLPGGGRRRRRRRGPSRTFKSTVLKQQICLCFDAVRNVEPPLRCLHLMVTLINANMKKQIVFFWLNGEALPRRTSHEAGVVGAELHQSWTGQNWAINPVSSAKTHRSTFRSSWGGFVVCQDHLEVVTSQDFIRGHGDEQLEIS